jgi:elongation factor G
VLGTDTTAEGEQVISAHVPSAEIPRYATDLRSLTGGRGRFTVRHDHYDILPSHLVDRAKASLADSQS